jgi:hypothetical protein
MSEDLGKNPVLDLSQAERDVIAERRRQVEKEGWTTQHDDDEHYYRELSRAAQGYVEHYNGRAWVFEQGNHDDYQSERVPDDWPWDEKWWKPKTPRKDLVRAAALLLAEIERIDRAEANHGEPG